MSKFIPFLLYHKFINDVTVLSVLFYDNRSTKVYFIKHSIHFQYDNLITL